MTDASSIAERYIALWNETDEGERKSLLTKHWTSDARYVDPLMQASDHDGISRLVAGVQARFPDFRFAQIGKADSFGDHVRFSWGLGQKGAEPVIKGTDFGTLDGGRLKQVTGFLDQVPASA